VPDSPLILLPIILGPTGSGKSDLALAIARAIGGEIVSFDSVQIYRGFDVGTAKVPPAERQGIAHHLIDIADAGAVFTAGDYARVAEETLSEIAGRRRVPVLVGGTGFYLRSLLEGLTPGPTRNDALRARLQVREAARPGSLHRILSRLDPESAARIHRNDKNKTIRALEVRLLAGAPLTAVFASERVALTGFLPVKMGLDPPRAELYSRLNDRARRMLDGGLMDEVRGLLDAGVPPDAKPFESLGYKQALQLLRGEVRHDEALECMQTETRRYAKRQLTWFRKEAGVQWIQGFGDDPRVQSEALGIVENAAAGPVAKKQQNNSEQK